MLLESRHCPEYSEFFFDWTTQPQSIDRGSDSDSGPMVGQNLSEVPDSGIGYTQDNRTIGLMKSGVNRTHINQQARSRGRKRRAGDRLDTRPNVDREVRREGTRWGTQCKRALLGSDGPDSMSSGSNVTEAQLRWPPDGEYPMVAQSGRSYIDDSLEEARSPRVELEGPGRIPEGVRIRRRGGAGEFFPDHETVGIYVDAGSQVFGEV